MSYVPRANSVAARVIEHLSAEGAPESLTAAEIGKLFGFDATQLSTRLAAPIAAGLLVREQRGAAYTYRLPREDDGQAFEACIWHDGTIELFGLQSIMNNGVPGVRLTAEQAEHVERLLRARAQG